jgi:hypothetical protein
MVFDFKQYMKGKAVKNRKTVDELKKQITMK